MLSRATLRSSSNMSRLHNYFCKPSTSSRLQPYFGYTALRARQYSTSFRSRKTTLLDLRRKHKDKQPLVWVTAYDYTSSLIIDQSKAIDAVLVGDSLGMVMLGYPNTTPVTMEDMVHHCKAVTAGARHTFVIGDMPFGSYEANPQLAVANAVRLMKEGGVDAIKLEGGVRVVDSVRAIVSAGIPVVGHIGLTPQTQSALGGFRVQGQTCSSALELISDAQALEQAGCFAIVIESVPEPVAALITTRVKIPTIGIGSGRFTSGQILVLHDMLGLHSTGEDFHVPRFVKKYRELGGEIVQALKEYSHDVTEGKFPAKEHTYAIKEEELKKLVNALNMHSIDEVIAENREVRPSIKDASQGTMSASTSTGTSPTERPVEGPSIHVDKEMKRKKITIVGGGSMGSFFGAKFAMALNHGQSSRSLPFFPEITILSNWTKQVSAINSDGLLLEQPPGSIRRVHSLTATSSLDDCQETDIAIIAVKSNQTYLASLKAREPSGHALTIQNGIGNKEILEKVLGIGRVLVGASTQGAVCFEPGKIQATAGGKIILALPTPQCYTKEVPNIEAMRSTLLELADLFNSVGIETECREGIEQVLWEKLIINSVINPISALLRGPNIKLLEDPRAREMMRKALQESVAVAQAKGITIPWEDPEAVIVDVIKATSTNTSSMCRDVILGRETEIDSINGAIVREGERLGVPVTFNKTLIEMVKSRVHLD